MVGGRRGGGHVECGRQKALWGCASRKRQALGK